MTRSSMSAVAQALTESIGRDGQSAPPPVFRAVAARVVHWGWAERPYVVEVKMRDDDSFSAKDCYATREQAFDAARAWLVGAVVVEEFTADRSVEARGDETPAVRATGQ